MPMRQGWTIQPSADLRENGEALSSVFGALVESHVYPDPYFAMNLRSARRRFLSGSDATSTTGAPRPEK